MNRALLMLMWFVSLTVAFFALEVPGGLPWWRAVIGGMCLGLASYFYEQSWEDKRGGRRED